MLFSFKSLLSFDKKHTLFSKFPTSRRLAILGVIPLSLLQGCDSLFPPTVAEICTQNPHMCNDLNPDAWCRAEKAEIIKHRFANRKDQSEQQKYQLILLFEDYEKCIVKASGIQHIKYREKETGRMKGVLTAQRELGRLARETRHSNDPLIAYYQWSRHGHEDSLKRFLYHEKTGNLETAELQVALSTIRMKEDLFEARKALYKALALYTSDQEVDTEIFPTLVTIHLGLEKIQMAYVWALVTSYFAENKINIQRKEQMRIQNNLDEALLEDIADEIISAIKAREFDAKALGISRN